MAQLVRAHVRWVTQPRNRVRISNRATTLGTKSGGERIYETSFTNLLPYSTLKYLHICIRLVQKLSSFYRTLRSARGLSLTLNVQKCIWSEQCIKGTMFLVFFPTGVENRKEANAHKQMATMLMLIYKRRFDPLRPCSEAET